MTPPPLPDSSPATVEKVRSGQKMLLWGVLLHVASTVVRLANPSPIILTASGLMGLLAIILSIIGTIRVSSGLRYHIALRIACCVFMIIPLANIVTLLILSREATACLRAAGYQVGLMGADKKVPETADPARPSFAEIKDKVAEVPLAEGSTWRDYFFATFSGPIPKNYGAASGVIMIVPEKITAETDAGISLTVALEYCQKPPFATCRNLTGTLNPLTREFTFSDKTPSDRDNWKLVGRVSENWRVLYLRLSVDSTPSDEFFLIHELTGADFIPDEDTPVHPSPSVSAPRQGNPV
jgi:hypothetical protein